MPQDRKKALEEFKELFNDISSKDRDDSKNSVLENNFEETVKEVSKELEKIEKGMVIVSNNNSSDNKENAHEVVKKMCKEDNNSTNKKEETVEFDDNNDDFDSLPENKEVIENKKETEIDFDFIPEKKENKEEINKKTVVDIIVDNTEIDFVGDKVKWILKSPTPMYNKFYDRKKELVELTEKKLGGQLNFRTLNKELEDAHVNVIDEIFDKDIVRKKMEEVQQHRERIKYISIRCNTQYFLWKRWIEKDMLKGYLARIEYLKPSIKQEGLVLEHMRDLEYYYSQLEALYNNCHKVEKTLEAAHEMLSRKVSICMELKPVGRYERTSNNREYQQQKQSSDGLDDFDEISGGEIVHKEKEKIGEVEWNEIL